MADPVQDIEEECAKAVFEVCDARERYPKRCAEELDKYLNLQNEIAMKPVVPKPPPQISDIPPPVEIRENLAGGDVGARRDTFAQGAVQLQNMTDKVQELKVVLKQLENNRNFEIKHHLK